MKLSRRRHQLVTTAVVTFLLALPAVSASLTGDENISTGSHVVNGTEQPAPILNVPLLQEVSPPLVVKRDELSQVTDEAGQDEIPSTPKLTGISPSPMVGDGGHRQVVLHGSGFSDGSLVAVSRGGAVVVLAAEKVSVLDSRRIAIELDTGRESAEWAVQVSTPDNRRSNVMSFRLLPAAPATLPSAAEKGVEPHLPAKAAAPAPAPSRDDAAQSILSSEWLAGQPKENYTLQLLASHSRYTASRFARQPGLAKPLAMFAIDKEGSELHVLTQGSYATRAEAEQAAKSLPAGIQPWIRSLQSVQEVMKRGPDAASVSETRGRPETMEFRDTAWVWSQDPGRYTIQLKAAESERVIEEAMRAMALPGELAVVRTLHRGSTRYALIYGSFADGESARGAIDRLPRAVRQAGPWLRRFGDLHDEISRATPPEQQ